MIKSVLEFLFCSANVHWDEDKSTVEEAWHECKICGRQVEFTPEEYEALKWNHKFDYR